MTVGIISLPEAIIYSLGIISDICYQAAMTSRIINLFDIYY